VLGAAALALFVPPIFALAAVLAVFFGLRVPNFNEQAAFARFTHAHGLIVYGLVGLCAGSALWAAWVSATGGVYSPARAWLPLVPLVVLALVYERWLYRYLASQPGN
jgi:hypothetical protein